ncbi:MAG TPA: PIN domain-containing protein [Treponema sp.]|nr:PIN domain-containing protein [Treponema sp.]HRU27675.1 PIN domain-containing protein [Treponema sp.]
MKKFKYRIGISEKILLDTNAYSAFMAGNSHVLEYIVESEEIYLSTIVIGELFAGFYGGKNYDRNIEELKRFLSKDGIKIIDVSIETSEIFGELKNSFLSKSKACEFGIICHNSSPCFLPSPR